MKTKEQLIQHFKEGIKENCLVCDERLIGEWTDYNGQMRCFTCGMTYQVLGSHLTEKFLSENELKKEDVAKKYCDDFMLVDLARDYWHEKKVKLPLGTYLTRGPITQTQWESFIEWLKSNAEKYKEDYKDVLNWEAILSK